jgi:glycerol-3-phosphate O-acyltransferase
MTSPIFGFNHARDNLVDEVVKRVCDSVRDPQLTLNETAYSEIRRLESKGGEPLEMWRKLARSLGKMSQTELKAELATLTTRHAWDIAGNFDPRVYHFATRAMPGLLGALLSPRKAVKNLPHILSELRPGHSGAALATLDDQILVQGPLADLRKLATQGTLVFVPTHLSNLDSVVFGFALERAGLPPATYGAGKNLFTNPALSFFMHNLGAYRVDRRLKHSLYKEVLKSYSCILIEHGYHSLFFPGGTRSRSGGVERRLKLGLAGTGVEAFSRTHERGAPQKVFFVPATINYLLTLEAETLIDDFLQEEGKARYIIEDDESTRIGRITSFMQKLLGLDGACVVRFSRPLDVFGNTVDENGRSYDTHGRPVLAESYIMGKGDRLVRDAARDAQYTRELGEVITGAYQRDTVIMATHLTSAAAFQRLRASVGRTAHGASDVFTMLRHRDDVTVPRRELDADVDKLLARVREMEQKGQIVLAPNLKRATGATVIDAALRAFAGYHTHPVLEPRGEDLVLADTRLLFYYQNRLAAHAAAAQAAGERPGLAVDFIAPKQTTRNAAA